MSGLSHCIILGQDTPPCVIEVTRDYVFSINLQGTGKVSTVLTTAEWEVISPVIQRMLTPITTEVQP